MPLRAEAPIVRVEPRGLHTIETADSENLFGLWQVFSKCAMAMEDGKRYENMAWRLWSRETFCCAPDPVLATRPWAFQRQLSASSDAELPALSESVASDDSHLESALSPTTSRSTSSASRPDLRRHDSATSQAARGKHITPIDLEKVVSSIQEKRAIEPLSPLPPQLAPAPAPLEKKASTDATTPRPASPPSSARFVPESSTSTVATALGSEAMSPPVGSDVSTSTDLSTHSIVKGFDPSHISTSIRSCSNLHPTPILKNSLHARPEPIKADPAKKKKAVFTLGGSSDEDNVSSFEQSYRAAARSSLSEGLSRPPPPPPPPMKNATPFPTEAVSHQLPHESEESEAMESAIASESEDEDEETDNAIEEEDSDPEWEDDNDDSNAPSVPDKFVFPRVESTTNLVSRRSLLTTALHQGDRAQALQNAASKSTPAIRRSRTSTPNGPSTGTSPQDDSGMMMCPQVPRSKPIIMTTSNVHPPALSPRTTRRNMLQTELTQSLRQNLLWERQQKNATTNAVNKRQHSAASIPALRRAATTNDIKGLNAFPQQAMFKSAVSRDAPKNNNSFNNYFDQGLQEYHEKGW